MKKKMYALSGVFMIVLVISGLWATKAINLSSMQQTIETPAPTMLAAGGSIQQMTEGASSIVIGDVLGTQSRWFGRSLITIATIRVDETLKGDPASTVEVAIPGGADFNRSIPIAVTDPEAAQIRQGETVALFLTPQGDIPNAYSVVGSWAGKFSIAKTDADVQVVTRDMTRARVQMGPGPTRGNTLAIPLSEFRELVKRNLK